MATVRLLEADSCVSFPQGWAEKWWGKGVGHRVWNDGQVTGRPSSANLIRLVNHNTLWGARDSPSEFFTRESEGGRAELMRPESGLSAPWAAWLHMDKPRFHSQPTSPTGPASQNRVLIITPRGWPELCTGYRALAQLQEAPFPLHFIEIGAP